MQIMIAEPDDALALTIASIVVPLGHTVSQVKDGTTVYAAAVSQQPDLILMGLFLPGCSGVTAAQQLRQHANSVVALIPIVAMAASVTLLALGRPQLFYSLLPTPLDRDELLELVDAAASWSVVHRQSNAFSRSASRA